MVCLRPTIRERRTGRWHIVSWSRHLGLCPFGACSMVSVARYLSLEQMVIRPKDMYDIASQLAMKWARQDPKTPIMVTDDFTRLTLDTIALCSMGSRFNSFYHDEMHPFVEAMIGLLQGSGDRARRPGLVNSLPTSENTKYWNDIFFFAEFCAGVGGCAQEESRRQERPPQRIDPRPGSPDRQGAYRGLYSRQHDYLFDCW